MSTGQPLSSHSLASQIGDEDASDGVVDGDLLVAELHLLAGPPVLRDVKVQQASFAQVNAVVVEVQKLGKMAFELLQSVGFERAQLLEIILAQVLPEQSGAGSGLLGLRLNLSCNLSLEAKQAVSNRYLKEIDSDQVSHLRLVFLGHFLE